MGFEAICFSNSDLNKSGFKTEDEAWDYAHGFDCDTCKDAEHNACIAEWDVFEEEFCKVKEEDIEYCSVSPKCEECYKKRI